MFKTIRKMMVFALAVSAMQVVFGGDDLAECQAAMQKALAQKTLAQKNSRRLLAASAQTDRFYATGDLNITVGEGVLNFNINVTKKYTRIKSALLVIDAWDVDYPCATEDDRVFFNNGSLGRLYGDNGIYSEDAASHSRFPVPVSWIYDGNNSLAIHVDVGNGGWVTGVRSAWLEITGSDTDVPAVLDIVSPYFDGERGSGGGRPAWFLSGVDVDVPIKIRCYSGKTKVVGYSVTYENQTQYRACNGEHEFQIDLGKVNVGDFKPGQKMEVRLKGQNEKWSEPFVANFFIAEKPYYGWWKVVEERFDTVVYGPIIANAETYSVFSDLNDADVILDPQSFINLNWKMPDLKWKVTPKIKCGLEMSSEDGLLSISAEVGRSGSGANREKSKNFYTGYLISSKKGNPSLSDYIKFLGGYNVLMKVGEYELYSGLRGRITRRWDDNCSSWRWNGGDGALHLYGSLGLNVGLPPACPLVSVGGKIETDVSFAITFDKNSLQDKLFLRVDGDPLIGADIYGQVGLSGLVALRGGERLRLYYGRQLLPARDCDKWGYQIYPYWEIYVLGGVYKGGTPNWKYLTMGEWWIGGPAIPKTSAHRLLANGNDSDNYDVQIRNKQSGYKALTRDYTNETDVMALDETQSVRPKAAARLMGGAPLSAGNLSVVEEKDTLIASGYPMPAPTTSMGAAGDTVAFLRDNVSRGAVDRTELVVQRNVDGKWKVAEPVWDDGTADFAPSMATLPDGTIIVAWQNLKQTYGDTVGIEQMMSDSEIVVAMRNPSTGVWSHKSLTSNAVVDHSPKVAVGSDGNAMIMWIRNDGNEILGTAEHPDKLYYARYANGAWGNESLLPTEGCTLLSTDIAMSGNEAIVTYTVDMDGTLEEGTDQELFAIMINGSGINNLRLTNDEQIDIRGTVRIRNNGNPVFIWSANGTVVCKEGWMGATNSVLTNATKVVTDFAVSPVAPDGKIALAFSSDGAEGMYTDPHLLVYDPVTQQWGEGLRIVENLAYEGNYSPAWDANGNVFMSYASYNTEKDANDYVQTKSADVKTIRFPVGADPAISTEDIYFTTNVLTVGEVVHVEAVIRNKGTLAAQNVGVTVKDAISGTVFSGTIAEIPGGGEYVYGFDWTVGDSIMSDLLDFEFTLTPGTASIDKDVSNNHVHWRGPEANVGIASAFSREQETNSKLLCARVRNFGFRKSEGGMKLTFRQGTANGTVLGAVDVPALNSGRENEFEARYSWDLSGLTFATNYVDMVAMLSDKDGKVVETFPFSVEVKSRTEDKPVVRQLPLYMVIDLSGGTNAVHFPVSFLDAVPQGGWTDVYKTTKLVLRKVEAGTFTMGSPEGEVGREYMAYDETMHSVTLTKPFYAGVFEVTQKQWELVCGEKVGGWMFREERHPADTLSYNEIRGDGLGATWPESAAVDSTSFFGILRTKTGVDAFDLPTEAQWEYACRAGTKTAINNGKNLLNPTNDAYMSEVARYNFNMYDDGYSIGIYGYHTAIVGSYVPNALGLYDMHGNVWEWCLDWASWDNMGDDVIDPVGAIAINTVGQRIVRGGNYCNYAYHARSAARYGSVPTGENVGGASGFRVFCMRSDALEALLENEISTVHVALVGDETEFSDYQYGQAFGSLPTPTSKDGLPFLGWYTSDGTQVTPATLVSEDHAQLFAKWDYSSTMEWKVQNEGGTYMVIDLSDGPNATNYPITYLDDVPAGGWTDEYKTTKLVLRRIPAGSGYLGSTMMTLTKDFYIGVFELTQKQWQLVMGDFGAHPITSNYGMGNSYPMYYLSYEDMRGNDLNMKWPKCTRTPEECFIGRIRKKTLIAQFDLPTRDQWYYAFSAGGQASILDLPEAEVSEIAWCACNAGGTSHPVGGKMPNAWGLYDMYGNVDEWGVDWASPGDYTHIDHVSGLWDFNVLTISAWEAQSYSSHSWVFPIGGDFVTQASSLGVAATSTTYGFYLRGARLCLTTGGHVIYGAPVIEPNSGLKTFPINVTLDNPNLSGTVVYYTIDGSEPSVTNGVIYTGPFELTSPATVRAFVHGISDSLKSRDSLVVSQTYYDSINDILDVDFGEWTTDEIGAWMPDGNGGMYSTGLTNGQASAISVQLSGKGTLEFDVAMYGDGNSNPNNQLTMRCEGEAIATPSEVVLIDSVVTNKRIRLTTYTLDSGKFTVTLCHTARALKDCYFNRVHLSNVTWTPYDYKITLDANDGSGNVTNVVAHYGCKMPNASAPVRLGYAFAGYYDALEGGTMYYSTTMESMKDWDGDSGITLYARWVPELYTVTFDANEGAGGSCEEMAFGAEIIAPTVTRIGYVFSGWSPAVARTVPIGGATYTAQWKEKTHTLTLVLNNGNGVDSAVVGYGSLVRDIDIPNRKGYSFVGWFADPNGGVEIDSDAFVMGDQTFYAHWIPNSYTVRFDANDGEGSMSDMVFEFDNPGALTSNVYVRAFHEFTGWATNATGEVIYSDGMVVTNLTAVDGGVVTLYAHWTPSVYAVKFDANGGTGSMSDQWFTYDAPQNLKANCFVNKNHVFVGWALSINGEVMFKDRQSVINLSQNENGDVTLFAVWEKDTFVPEFWNHEGGQPKAACVYDGLLYDDVGNIKGTVRVKLGKWNDKTKTRTVSMTVVSLDGKKKTHKLTTGKSMDSKGVEITAYSYALTGEYNNYKIEGARNTFTSKIENEAPYASSMAAKWPVVNVAWEGGTLTALINKKGKVKVTCNLMDGKKITTTSQLIVGLEWNCVPVVYAKKGVNIAFGLWLSENGRSAVVTSLEDVVAGKPGTLKADAKFHIDAGAFSTCWGQAALPYLPDGVAVMGDAKWTLPKAGKVRLGKDGSVDAAKLLDNPSALKLTYKAKDDTFKGKFKAYSMVKGKLKAVTVNVAGVLIDGIGYGAATIKKVGGVPVTVE